jgi:NAD-dependent dihydropyrimidine dehydrogenase PreA subunit
MPFVIGSPCIDVMDRSCIEECPVDCIYVGERKLYIQPDECIDCGACMPTCPVEAISMDRRVSAAEADFAADNAAFFRSVLPGRQEPIGAPGGAAAAGAFGVDTRLVEAFGSRSGTGGTAA